MPNKMCVGAFLLTTFRVTLTWLRTQTLSRCTRCYCQTQAPHWKVQNKQKEMGKAQNQEKTSPVGIYKKVNRCLARYSPRATTTNRLTNRALNKPAWPGQNWPKMPVLGEIWSFLGKKSFFLQEKSKVLLPTKRKTHLGTLFTLVFGRALDKMCKKWQYLAQNDQKCRFWTKFGHFWAKKPNFYGSK